MLQIGNYPQLPVESLSYGGERWMRFFADRVDAGKKLASALRDVENGAVVLAVPRGGVVLGYEIAHALGLPLDVIITKKAGAPGNPELAIGAVAEDGAMVLDENTVRYLRVSQEYIDEEVTRQTLEIKRRLESYRGKLPYPRIVGREVIVVDDGVATGATLKAALISLHNRGAKSVIAAVPVGPASTVKELEKVADRVVCLQTPEPFYAIGEFYEDFDQTSDEEVVRLLNLRRKEMREKEVNA